MQSIDADFPFEAVSALAEAESWRREVYRPIYHVHKWWAQRSGSLFRAAIIAACLPEGEDVMKAFYSQVRFPKLRVFDPFMGSGTTVGEALKLGCMAMGKEINPVAFRAVSVALGSLDRSEIEAAYTAVEKHVARRLSKLYECEEGQVLYWFWVRTLRCPNCYKEERLFPRYIFASHATAKGRDHVLCKACGNIFDLRRGAQRARCPFCETLFDPRAGSIKGAKADCGHCGRRFSVTEASRLSGAPPTYAPFAKLVLCANGTKRYYRATPSDLDDLVKLRKRLKQKKPLVPDMMILDGENTRQLLAHGFKEWSDLFNPRQLLALTELAGAIRRLPTEARGARQALALLFSGTLEWNNMLATYKGEGTGAVRHAFSHHVLRPANMPVEANVWGTPKSSGSFSTLYRSRLLRALDYRERPFEIRPAGDKKKAEKVYGLSDPINPPTWYDRVRLMEGTSTCLDQLRESVDLVLTDPPWFDNVHYSELADFFEVWHARYFDGFAKTWTTSRREGDVQDTEPDSFAEKLATVWKECRKVLIHNGRLVFTFAHARAEGWAALADAVYGGGFNFVACYPISSEMRVASPKHKAREPLLVEILFVCATRQAEPGGRWTLLASAEEAVKKVRRHNEAGRTLGFADVRSTLVAQCLVGLSRTSKLEEASSRLKATWTDIEAIAREITEDQRVGRCR